MWVFFVTDSCSLIAHKPDVFHNQITAVISVDLEMMRSLHLLIQQMLLFRATVKTGQRQGIQVQ